jgi:phage FluMu protein Com
MSDVNAICSRCQLLCPNAAPVGHPPLCPRCDAVDELLKTTDELHAQVRRALNGNSQGERVLARSALIRAEAIVARVRSL